MDNQIGQPECGGSTSLDALHPRTSAMKTRSELRQFVRLFGIPCSVFCLFLLAFNSSAVAARRVVRPTNCGCCAKRTPVALDLSIEDLTRPAALLSSQDAACGDSLDVVDASLENAGVGGDGVVAGWTALSVGVGFATPRTAETLLVEGPHHTGRQIATYIAPKHGPPIMSLD